MENELDVNNFYIIKGYINNYNIGHKFKWAPSKIKLSRFFQEYIYLYAKKLISKYNINSILDIGCGYPVKLELLYEQCKDITCIDKDKYLLSKSKKIFSPFKFYVDDIENPKVSFQCKYDLVISANVIEHLNNPDTLIKYIKRTTNKKSFILLSTPERDILRGLDCNGCVDKKRMREWNSKEFEEYLNHRDFEIIEHKIVPFIGINGRYLLVENEYALKKYRLTPLNHLQMVLCKNKK